ncbi:hypothetical protein E0I74_22470 [Rhizobium laguerreae]|nr:hypothetical protein [Rhizobium laguerreae]OOO45365.1 hypothetical protein BS630_26320 [Rhizobium laguerreae]TBX76184.1 hypothetical protein E0I74_22470 [Rhizobium laguerreae]TBY09425.1 hypothetical protein E0I94_16550 [Rhizobium laguerreae]
MEAASAPMVCGIVTVSTAAVIAATTTTAAVVVISIIVIGKRSGHGEPGVTQRQGQKSKYPADSCSSEEAQRLNLDCKQHGRSPAAVSDWILRSRSHFRSNYPENTFDSTAYSLACEKAK